MRVEVDGGAALAGGAGGVLLLQQRAAEIGGEGGALAVQLAGALLGGDRGWELPALELDAAEAIPGEREVRLQLGRLVERRLRAVVALLIRQHHAEIGPGDGIARAPAGWRP